MMVTPNGMARVLVILLLCGFAICTISCSDSDPSSLKASDIDITTDGDNAEEHDIDELDPDPQVDGDAEPDCEDSEPEPEEEEPSCDGCLIEDVCHGAGTVDPDQPCAVCDPQQNAEAWSPATADTLCREAAGVCDVAEYCDGSALACPDDAFKAETELCREAAGECDAPEYCSADAAACPQDAFMDSDTTCGDAGTECVNQDFCDGSGACVDNGFVAADTPCGDAPTECSAQDTCNGAGVCLVNHLDETTPCGDAGTECVNQDFCDGNGACTDNGFVAADTPCGDAPTECSAQDTCNGAGVCLANHLDDTTTCDDAGTECVNQDMCDGNGACTDNGFVAVDTPCGDAPTECSAQDTCNGAGVCLANHLDDTTTCGDAGTECVNQDMCDGSGACTDNGFVASDTPCGDAPTECSAQDTCDGAGLCLANHLDDTTTCGDAGTECVNQDMCDGNGACKDNGFAEEGTVCNSDDQCDGGGVCVDCITLDGCGDYADDGNACTSVVCENTLCIDVNDDDNACDLGYTCTEDHCVAGVCEIQSISGCLIEGICVAEGDSQDDDGCVACDPATSNTAWTNMDGTACAVSDDGNVCTDAVCRSGLCAFEGNTSYACDDGDPCTYDDACTADGQCGGLAYSCNDHGTCSGDGSCSCAEGYAGAYCDECPAGYFGYPNCQPIMNPSTGFVPIEAGPFWMGSPDGCPGPDGYAGNCTSELGRDPSNETLHYVSLTYDFEMNPFETTKGEFEALIGWEPMDTYDSDYTYGYGEDHPITYVSWYDALVYLNEASKKMGLTPCYVLSNVRCHYGGSVGWDYMGCYDNDDSTYGGISQATVRLAGDVSTPQLCEGYRLPTEAEWEYAARAGTTTAFYNGEITHTGIDPVDPNLDQIAWFGGNNTPFGTKPVGSKTPNSWGLYDMSGSVWEWNWDWYEREYESDVAINPVGPNTGSERVVRGGSWNLNAFDCRSATREYYYPEYQLYRLGFRMCRTLPSVDCNPDFCNGHGNCVPADGTCLCNEGYSGDYCDQCADGYAGYPQCGIPIDGDEDADTEHDFYPEDYCFSNQCWPASPTGFDGSCFNRDWPMPECPGIAGSDSCATIDFCGQDGQYPDNYRILTCYNVDGTEQAPCDSMADTGEVVADSLTGLMWQRTMVFDMTWYQAAEYCANLTYAGFNDWRLPSLIEFQSIRRIRSMTSVEFPRTPYSWFWTLSSVRDSNKAWVALPSHYNTELIGKYYQYNARCVRTKIPLSIPESITSGSELKYEISEPVAGQQIVSDQITGLVWPMGNSGDINWKDALSYCESLEHGGFNDWRMPNITELFTLVSLQQDQPASNFPSIPSSAFWSSTNYRNDAYCLAFDHNGSIIYLNKDSLLPTECVRTGEVSSE